MPITMIYGSDGKDMVQQTLAHRRWELPLIPTVLTASSQTWWPGLPIQGLPISVVEGIITFLKNGYQKSRNPNS